MRVLIHNSHHQTGRPDGWSGAPGEAVWVLDLNDRIETLLKAQGVEVVRVDGDLQDHTAFHSDYDAFIAPHYEADVHNRGGAFWGRASASLTGAADDRLGNLFWGKFKAIEGAPPDAFEWSNPNVTDYYGFRLTSNNTPGILVEHGVGWGDNKAWLRDKIGEIAQAWVNTLLEFGKVVVPTAPTATLAVLGPTRPFTASESEWAPLYRTLGPLSGVDGSVAYSQALHETANFVFGGTAKVDWNNPAGIGVTGAPDVGNKFASKEDGVRAHLGHLLWYFGPIHPVVGFCDKDPRHFGAHKNLTNDITSLNGRWAVPGTNYGQAIAAISVRITQEGPVTDDEFLEKYKRLLSGKLEQEFLDRQALAVQLAVKAVADKLAK